MKLVTKSSISILTFAVCTLFSLTSTSISRAEDKKADATGNWSWTTPGRNGGPDRKMMLKLKAEGEKLTGTLSSPGQGGETTKSEIEEGKIKGDEVSFTVNREFNGAKRTFKYTGKLSADTIKGKTEFERNGETQSRDWEAKRATEAK